jgi:hypothetical protein
MVCRPMSLRSARRPRAWTRNQVYAITAMRGSESLLYDVRQVFGEVIL